MFKKLNVKSTGLGKGQTKGQTKKVETIGSSMTPNDVLQKYGMNAFIELMENINPEWTITPYEDGTGFSVDMGNPTQMVNITEDKFSEYRRCQKLGKFNMLDYFNWEPYTTLTECEWFQIISNYRKYLNEFEGCRIDDNNVTNKINNFKI